jgi:glutathione S-transferase
LVPIIPLAPPPGWSDLSPLGKIPVLRTPELTVADSSVICQYLERTHAMPPIYPADPIELAKALWLEEFVDGGLAPHVLGGLLLQRVFAERFLQRPPDQALIRRSLEHEIPPKLAYLESVVRGEFLVGSAFSIADITVASMLINFRFAGEQLTDYPNLQKYLKALFERRCFQEQFAAELPSAEQIERLDVAVLREASS